MTLRPHRHQHRNSRAKQTAGLPSVIKLGVLIVESWLARAALIRSSGLGSTLADLLIVHLYNASKCKRACNLPKGKHEAHFAVSHDSWAALNDDTHKSRNSLKGHQHYGLRGRERATNSGFSTKPTSERPKRQLISRAVGTVLSLRRHPIKLERYRED